MISVDNDNNEKRVTILYTNYRGETSVRTIVPGVLWFGATKYHPIPQWLLTAVDVEKNATRDFAVADIRQWQNFTTEISSH